MRLLWSLLCLLVFTCVCNAQCVGGKCPAASAPQRTTVVQRSTTSVSACSSGSCKAAARGPIRRLFRR